MSNQTASACIICGKRIVYTEKSESLSCEKCGRTFSSNSSCEDGHYICDHCHGSGAMAVIKPLCMKSDSSDPHEISNLIMRSSAVHMHGPEHHVIVGSALATAYKNAGGDLCLPDALDIIEQRGGAVPGGICGNWGCCGAAVGAGIFMSVLTKTSPMSCESWGLCNLLTSDCLRAMGKLGGPRCCKRNVSIAIDTAIGFVEQRLGVKMEKTDVICGFNERNKECIKSRCPYYKS